MLSLLEWLMKGLTQSLSHGRNDEEAAQDKTAVGALTTVLVPYSSGTSRSSQWSYPFIAV